MRASGSLLGTNSLLRIGSAPVQGAILFLCLAAILLNVACYPTGTQRGGGRVSVADLSARIQSETMRVTVNAVAPERHRFQASNLYTSLATFKGNTYALSYDSARRPYLHKVSENTRRCERAPLDSNQEDVYRAYADGHHHSSYWRRACTRSRSSTWTTAGGSSATSTGGAGRKRRCGRECPRSRSRGRALTDALFPLPGCTGDEQPSS